MQRRILHYSGRVQGVGFRYTAYNTALRYNVTGYVRNGANGDVEVIVEGPERDIDQFLEALKGRMGEYIDDVHNQTAPATGEYEQFSIKH